MKKSLILVLFLLVLVPSFSQAQNNSSMRSIAASQLYQYGQAMYHRGDFVQSAVVMRKVLSIDPQHQGAINYAHKLNTKGEHITIPKSVKAIEIKEVKKETVQLTQQKPVVMKQVKAPVVIKEIQQKQSLAVDLEQGDLKEDILKANQTIEKLKAQVAHLRNEIAQGNKILPVTHSNK